MKARRLFIALEIPEQVQDLLAKCQEQIRALHCLKGSYVNPKNMHLTLKFLGNVDESQVPAVIERLKSVQMQSLALSLGAIGKFPEHRHTRVIWASVSGEGLEELAVNVEAALADVATPSAHPFQAHLTLVRVAESSDEEKLAEGLSTIRVEPLEFVVDSFDLIHSLTLPQGAKYETLARFGPYE